MVHLISARHTFSTFVFRYQENGGKAVNYDLVVNHKVEVPVKEESAAPSMKREPRMERLDPNEWKRQDHYMVLGIEEKRGQVCSPEDIRNAYRARVLVYHPDKIAQRAGEGKGKRQKDDAIFKCIQKAFEILNDPDRKESFDHVDPTFDNSIPEEKLPSSACFYATYGPVFERNLKFSKKKPTALKLGDASSPRADVEAFYQFWFDFDSTRRFDYLDEDDCETGDNRADKRWQEKKNKAARAKRKTEDNTRLRMLAEQAYKADPRIKAFKEADKLAKQSKKTQQAASSTGAKTSGAPASQAAKAAEEAKRVAEEEAKAKDEALKAAKAAREAEANALRKERKAFKSLFAEHSYFVPTTGIDAAAKLRLMEEEAALVEQVCQKLDKLSLGQCREEIAGLAGDKANFARVTNVLRDRLGVALKDNIAPVSVVAAPAAPTAQSAHSMATTETVEEDWSVHDMDLLINGAKKFPGGTRNRWETITEWFNRQAEVPRDMDALLRKSNSLKSSTATPGAAPIEADPMASLVSAAKRDPRINQNEPTLAITSTDAHIPWTGDETLALQAAIKSVPAEDPQRWDAIASLVPSRTKKECMLRAKELATLLKKKSVSSE